MTSILDLLVKKIIPDPDREEILNDIKESYKDNGRSIARRLTRGNVSIQVGAFDVDETASKSGAVHPRLENFR